MRHKVEMTLNAETAERFQEIATRLASLGDDGMLAATVLLRIVESYERAAVEASPINRRREPQRRKRRVGGRSRFL